MRILITGASGFIGTNLLLYFVEKKIEVLNVDIASPKDKELMRYWKEVDILDYNLFRDSILSFDPHYIVHLAARTDLEGKTLADYSVNSLGVENLLKIINRDLPNLKKLIVASSMLVCHAGYYPKNQLDYAPTTVYGESKIETEKEVWANRPICDWAIIRPTSIWGPWFGIPYRNFFDMICSRKYVHIGNKGCTKTYGYVGNAIYQINEILFSSTSEESDKVFFIGDSPAINIEEWGNEIAQELGIKIPKVPYFIIKLAALLGDILRIVGINFPMTSFRLKNMTTDNVIDLSKTYKVAPVPPFTRLEGIKETLKWINK